MIQIIMENGLACPKILCDSCGKEISNAEQAAVVYINFKDNGEMLSVAYVHKNFVYGNCLTKAEELIRLKGEEPGWDELSRYLANLIVNVGLSSEDIERKIKMYY